MKKLIAVVAIIAFVMTLSVTVFASTSKATLINSNGDKVVVAVGSKEAQSYFAIGYVLMTNKLGAVTGPDVYFDMNVRGTLTTGGGVYNASSTLVAAKTLTATNVCNNSIITVNNAAVTSDSAAASLDITMPATSTLFGACLNHEGARTSFIFVNASPTAASTTEMIAGTGCESFKSQDTGAADTVPGLGAAKITLMRAKDYMGVNAANDCLMFVEPFVFD